jgi:protein translocase SecG subunit
MQLIIQVFIIITALLLIILVLMKSDTAEGISALTGGGGMSETPFGASGGDILNKVIFILGIVFLTLCFTLGVYNKYMQLKPEKHLQHPYNWPVVKKEENGAKTKQPPVIQSKKADNNMKATRQNDKKQ